MNKQEQEQHFLHDAISMMLAGLKPTSVPYNDRAYHCIRPLFCTPSTEDFLQNTSMTMARPHFNTSLEFHEMQATLRERDRQSKHMPGTC